MRDQFKKLTHISELIVARLKNSPIWDLIDSDKEIGDWLKTIEDSRTMLDQPVDNNETK